MAHKLDFLRFGLNEDDECVHFAYKLLPHNTKRFKNSSSCRICHLCSESNSFVTSRVLILLSNCLDITAIVMNIIVTNSPTRVCWALYARTTNEGNNCSGRSTSRGAVLLLPQQLLLLLHIKNYYRLLFLGTYIVL